MFYDDNVDAHTVYTEKDESYAIGCLTTNCKYYKNAEINFNMNDIWHTFRKLEFYDIPSIQN